MKYNKIILLFLPFVILGIACPKPDGEDCQKDYLFTIPISLYPRLDTFKIGDTAWIEINIAATQIESYSQVEKDISDFPFKIDAAFVRYDSSGFYFAANEFTFVNEIGGLITYGSPLPITSVNIIKNIDGSHKLRAGCIPQKKGIYRVEFSSLATDGVFESGYYEKNCLEEFFFRYDMNNNLDSNNFELLQTFPPSVVGTFESHKFYGCYAFRVVE